WSADRVARGRSPWIEPCHSLPNSQEVMNVFASEAASLRSIATGNQHGEQGNNHAPPSPSSLPTSPAAATIVTPTSPLSMAATSPLHHSCFGRIAVSSPLIILVSVSPPREPEAADLLSALAGHLGHEDVIALTWSVVNSPHSSRWCALPRG